MSSWMISMRARCGANSARCLLPFGISLWICHLLALSVSAMGSESSSDRDVVRRGVNPVWVNPDSEDLHFPAKQLQTNDVSDRHDSIAQSNSRKSLWELLFGNSSGNPGSTGNSFWTSFFTAIFNAWVWILLGFLILLLLIVLALVIRAGTFGGVRRVRKSAGDGEDVLQQRAKISDLPFEMETPIVGLRAQAEYLRSKGEYTKAIIYLFSYLLVELDSSHCIRLERGKTNGGYIRDLRSRPALQGYLRKATHAFERVYFGRHDLDAATFEGLWAQLPSIEAEMKTPPSSSEWSTSNPSTGHALTGAQV
ncbi:MAG: DUF4129 domain-containing protein [Planctomycetota bacterium]